MQQPLQWLARCEVSTLSALNYELRQETPRLTFRAPSTHAEVNDVRWHPTRPGVFASVLGNGRVELWDVCRSVLEPVAVFVRESKPTSAELHTFQQVLVTSALSKRRVTHGSSCRLRAHHLQVSP